MTILDRFHCSLYTYVCLSTRYIHFSVSVQNTDGFDMRVDPVGRDSDGNHYWYFIGSQLYRESAEHYKRCTTGQKEGGGSQRGSRGGQSARSARKRGGKGRVKRNAKEKEAATEENADDVDKTEDM